MTIKMKLITKLKIAKYANWIRRVIKFPICIVLFPIWLTIVFLLTDWEDYTSVKDSKEILNIFK